MTIFAAHVTNERRNKNERFIMTNNQVYQYRAYINGVDMGLFEAATIGEAQALALQAWIDAGKEATMLNFVIRREA